MQEQEVLERSGLSLSDWWVTHLYRLSVVGGGGGGGGGPPGRLPAGEWNLRRRGALRLQRPPTARMRGATSMAAGRHVGRQQPIDRPAGGLTPGE